MESIETPSPSLIPLIPLIPPIGVPEKGGTSALPSPMVDWRPEFKIWLTPDGELCTTGVCGDLAAEIVKITADNLSLQRTLLELHCETFDRHHIGDRWEEWEERAAIMEHDGGLTREAAELEAAKQMNLMAFMEDRGV
jgi:hypothetical protein